MKVSTHVILPVTDDRRAIRALRWVGFLTPTNRIQKTRIVLVGVGQDVSKRVHDAARFPFTGIDVHHNADVEAVVTGLPVDAQVIVIGTRLPTHDDWIETRSLADASDQENFVADRIREHFDLPPEAPAPTDGRLFYALAEINVGFGKLFQTKIPLDSLRALSNVRGREYTFAHAGPGLVSAHRTR